MAKPTVLNPEPAPASRCLIGWWVICEHDFEEPEGTVLVDATIEPQVGDRLRLSDGKDWVILSVNTEELSLRVHYPGSP